MAKKKRSGIPKEMAETKDAIMDALVGLKVTSVAIEWNGGGDSGGVESVEAHDDEQDIEVDLKNNKVSVNSRKESWDPKTNTFSVTFKKEEKDLREAIEEFCMDWVDFKGSSGWYNNEGGQGSAQIDVKNREITLEHSNNESVSHSVGTDTI